MSNVKLYFRTAKSLTLAHYWDMRVPNYYDETEELWDDGADYVLPAGYSVGENIHGEPHIYDPNNQECDIVKHSSGRPQLISAMRSMPVLKRADD